MGFIGKKRFTLWQVVVLLAIVISGMAALTYAAAPLAVPNTFTSGTTISSSEMNSNFAAIQNTVNNLVRTSYIENTVAWYSFNSTTFVPVVENTQVKVSTDGILLIWCNLTTESPGVTNLLVSNIEVDGTGHGLDFWTPMRDTGDWDTRTKSYHVAVPVTAGIHNVALTSRFWNGNGATVTIWNSNIMTLFVPFGNDGIAGAL